jgi:hypothetical protein
VIYNNDAVLGDDSRDFENRTGARRLLRRKNLEPLMTLMGFSLGGAALALQALMAGRSPAQCSA